MRSPRRSPYHGLRLHRRDRLLVYAHRGASAYAPENTCEAFALARRQGADAIECDVMRCGSGELVVCHDDRLERLCGESAWVSRRTLTELRALRVLADRFPGADARIPTLGEAVEAAGPEMLWNVELKVDGSARAEPLARQLLLELERLPLTGRVIVSSFHPHALLTIRALAPDLPTAYLFSGGPRLWHGLWGAITATAALHPEHPLVDAAAVRRWHARGLAVNVWTVDDVAVIRALFRDGVDGVITNRPDDARATFAS